jgi:DNA-binding NarL/FixJ family response regulator
MTDIHGRKNGASTTRAGRPARPAAPRAKPYSVAVPIRLVLAEDNYLVREGVRQLIDAQPELDVVAVCTDFDSLLAAVEEHKPDVVLTDIRMPPTGTDEGIRAAERLRESHPRIGVVILSQFSEPDYALALLQKGAAGRAYLLKERVSDIEQLVTAIREVANGGSVIDPKVIEGLVAAKVRKPQSPLADLTPREHEVLALMAQGKNNAAIAATLFLTERAVEKHINSIFSKLSLAEEKDTHRRVRAALLYLSESKA